MINQKRNGCATAIYSRGLGSEVSGDFTLPDYQNEIRRILEVIPTVLPPAKYVSDTSAEFNGTVDYQVVYVGADGGVYSVPLSSDYNISVPLDNVGREAAISAFCTVSAENVSTRVSAPRRLGIRTRLRADICVLAHSECGSTIAAGAAASDIYTYTEKIPTLQSESATTDIIKVSYIAPLGSEDVRVVLADAGMCEMVCNSREGVIDCSGTLNLRLLCVSEESGEYTTLESKIPVEGQIDMDSVSADSLCRTCGYVSDVEINVTDAGIECEIGVIFEGKCTNIYEAEYMSDMYSTEYDCICRMENKSVRRMLCHAQSGFTVSERIALENTSLPADAEIVECTASAGFDRCECMGNKCAFSGNAKFCVIYSKDGEMWSTELAVPIKYEAPTLYESDANAEISSFEACAGIYAPKIRINDGNVCIDAEVYFSGECMTQKTVSVVEEAQIGETKSKREPELVVCYPAKEDTVWSIAKRYSVAPSAVIGDPKNDKYVMIE